MKEFQYYDGRWCINKEESLARWEKRWQFLRTRKQRKKRCSRYKSWHDTLCVLYSFCEEYLWSFQGACSLQKQKLQVNQFNLMASEMISLNRSLQDVRLSACKNKVTLAFSTTFANFFDCLFVILGLRELAADHLSSNCLPQWGVDHTSQNGCVNI